MYYLFSFVLLSSLPQHDEHEEQHPLQPPLLLLEWQEALSGQPIHFLPLFLAFTM